MLGDARKHLVRLLLWDHGAGLPEINLWITARFAELVERDFRVRYRQDRIYAEINKPPVGRRLRLPTIVILAPLYEALQIEMRWDDGRMYEFRAGQCPSVGYSLPTPSYGVTTPTYAPTWFRNVVETHTVSTDSKLLSGIAGHFATGSSQLTYRDLSSKLALDRG